MNSFTGLRYVALAEASSFLALLVAAYLKRQDQGESRSSARSMGRSSSRMCC